MKTVWKYKLEIDDYNDIDMPEGSEVLSVALQDMSICLWVLVDPTKEKVTRHFRMAGTGHEIDEEGDLEFIGTVLLDHLRLVFHVFEIKDNS